MPRKYHKKTKAQKEEKAKELITKTLLRHRAKNKCEWCGVKAGAKTKSGKKAYLQWCHIAGRKGELKYNLRNLFCLCPSCHLKFDNSENRLESYAWLQTKRTPEELAELREMKDKNKNKQKDQNG
ncbi:MAG: HNH endonuclease [Patescibacteria group bacterium]|nr:HNH endonuclease [Patescibacteria group bacterium]